MLLVPSSQITRLVLLLALLASCNPIENAASPLHSATPLPTVTGTSPPTQLPADTATALQSTGTSTTVPSPAPSSTSSPTPAFSDDLYPPDIELPPAEIELLSPAEGARIVSPITIRANLFPGPAGRIRIELLGEDGRSLSRNLLVWTLSDNVKQSIQTALYFEVEGVAEAGRLIISVNDELGRLKALSSADVILLSDGLRETSFSTDMQERILILSPEAGSVVESGIIEISGLARPQGERPLSVQIIARDGRVLGFGQVYPSQPEGYDYSIFSIQLEAEVTVRQWVQIAVRETSLRVPGDVHFSSFEVILAP